jgi:hypothetical protein
MLKEKGHFAIPRLLACLKSEGRSEAMGATVRLSIISALEYIGPDKNTAKAMTEILLDNKTPADERRRASFAIKAMKKEAQENVSKLFIVFEQESDFVILTNLEYTFLTLGPLSAKGLISILAKTKDPKGAKITFQERSAILTLGKLGAVANEALPVLTRFLQSDSGYVQAIANDAIKAISEK